MATCRSRLFSRLLRPRPILRPLENGGLNVDWTTILALVVAVGLAIYLTAALLGPEKFS